MNRILGETSHKLRLLWPKQNIWSPYLLLDFLEINRISNLASDFREKIKDLPLEIKCNCLGNSVTGVYCINSQADDIVNALKTDYAIWVNPNGGEIGEKMFRVGHIGDLTIEDNDKLIEAFKDLEKRGILK